MMQMDRKPVQNFALIVGVLYVVIGIMGFIPALVKEPPTSPEMVGLGFKTGYGYLMGLFPINPLHNVVHLLIGFLGIAASIALDSARLYSGVLALLYGLLAIILPHLHRLEPKARVKPRCWNTQILFRLCLSGL
jgi:hypothetical protein